MTEAQEVRARAKALRERREELEKALAGAAGPGARPLWLELARVKEELVDCARRLKELMPSHKVRCRTTWAGVDGWQWDRFQYQTWAELEGAGEQDGPTELDRMRLAVRLARERAVTDKQGEYLAQVEGGKKAAQVAREAGRHRGTVSRTVGRGRTKIAKEAKALYEVLQAQQGPGPLVVDLADGRVLEAVLSLLTPRQQLFCQLIRDADKIDIFRVYVMYMRQKKNIWNVDWSDFENQPISDVVMAQARQGKLVRTQDKKTFMDFYVGALCLYFDLVYPKSRQLAREQGYLDRLLDFHSQNVDSEGKLDEIRRLVRGTGTLPQPSFTGTIYKNM